MQQQCPGGGTYPTMKHQTASRPPAHPPTCICHALQVLKQAAPQPAALFVRQGGHEVEVQQRAIGLQCMEQHRTMAG